MELQCAAAFITNAGFSLGTFAVDWACVGNEQQGKGISTQRSSGRRGSDKASKSQPPAEPSAPSEEGAESPTSSFPDPACAPTSTSFPQPLKRQSHRTEAEETPEQLVAVARGGVRHAGKVFHRRGVKLTEDSPRSMIPRDVSQPCRFQPSLLPQVRCGLGWLIGCGRPQKNIPAGCESFETYYSDPTS